MHKRLIPLVLAYTRDGEPIDGRTRLQKMVFVIQQELTSTGTLPDEQRYEFFPYDYGPFSKELAETVDAMIEAGLLAENEVEYDEEGNVKYLYELKPSGRALVEDELTAANASMMDARELVEKVEEIKRRFNEELSLPEVIDEVYAEYPEYAENSVY